MKATLIALLCLVSAVLAADENTHVLTLDSTNFQDALKNNPMIMVEFYAPWCGHCKRLAPEYEKAAEELKGSGLILAAINADDEPNRIITQQFGIQGFPTLKFFRNGQPKDYEGDRTATAIVAFMRKQNRPAIQVVSASNEEALKFGDSDRVVILGVFDKAEGPEYEIFKTTAEANRDKFTFGQVVGDTEFAKQLGAPVPNVLLFKKFDEGKNILGNDFTNLVQFINTNSVPFIDEIGGHNYKFYAESGLPLGYIFVKPTENKLVTDLHDMAKNTKGKINWVWIDFDKYARHGERLGLGGKVVPAIAIEHNGKHWAFDEKAEVTVAAVTSWVDQYVSGSLSETVRSEEVPATQTEPVIKVVAKSWEQTVGDPNKDVFLMFYAPWCGHCKALHPTFEQLATKLKGVNSVSIAQIDATANDVDPKLGIRGFPTLKLFPANDKSNVIDYEGDRSLDDMLRFIQNGASIDFKIPSGKTEEAVHKEEL